ncbi:MAG: S41 family peptidase [Caldilineaceae bacterium]
MIRRVAMVFLGIFLLAGSFGFGHLTGVHSQAALAADEPSEFAVFWEAWDLVLDHFVDQDKIDFKRMTYGAIEGMLATLGDEGHTTFLSPESVEMHQSSLEGAFEGIGAYVSMEDTHVTIVAPIDGSPAEAAGILPGDIVLAVDGESVEGMTLNDVISLIRGPANTEVILHVLHVDAEAPVDIAVIRQKIELDSVRWAIVPDTTIAYVSISQFAADTGQELESALRDVNRTKIDGKSVSGLILDLRNNPGGYLREAIRVGSQFLPNGATILIEADADENTTVYRSRGWGYARNIPMVVLINEGTASAGEITAGAIKENGRGLLVGATTFGTGTVLNQFNLSDGSAILLGVTNWLTPDSNLIKGQGVEPDFMVEQTPSTLLMDAGALEEVSLEELLTTDDAQFLRALEAIGGDLPQLEAAKATETSESR